MSDFFLKVPLPPSGIPRKTLRFLKERQSSGEPLFVYVYREREAFRVKPRKNYVWYNMWMILSSKSVEDYATRRWKEEK